MTDISRPEIELQWLGTVDQGKQLEISATIDDVVHAIATIVADGDDESLWFEVYVNDQVVQIPINKVREALDMAIGEVHSEEWYEKNVYPKIPRT